IRGVSFQPVFSSGRIAERVWSLGSRVSGTDGPGSGGSAWSPEPPEAIPRTPDAGPQTPDPRPQTPDAIPQTRLNTADIILAAVEQSQGKLRFEDFTPLPCGDPNCATIG